MCVWDYRLYYGGVLRSIFWGCERLSFKGNVAEEFLLRCGNRAGADELKRGEKIYDYFVFICFFCKLAEACFHGTP